MSLELDNQIPTLVLQNAACGFILIDESGLVCLWNRWITKCSGISEEQALGRKLEDIFALRPDPACLRAIEQALHSGKSTLLSQSFHPHPLPLYRKIAKKTLMTQRLVIQAHGFGNRRYCSIEVTDQSAGAEREKFLAHSKDYITKIIESIQDLMFVLDLEGRIREINRMTSNVLGYSSEDMLGKPLTDFAPKHKLPDVWSAGINLNDRLYVQDTEIQLQCKDGSIRTLILAGSFIEGRDNVGRVFVGIAKDITERRQAEEQLISQRAQLATASKLSALGEMAGGIAHEINNPLAIIHGLSYQLRKRLKKNNLDETHEAFQLIGEIEMTTKRISKIIKGLKAIARTGDKDDFYPASLKTIVDDTLSLCMERFKTLGIKLSISNIHPELMIECRQIQISQVLLNLLNNAKDAITEQPERWIKIDVRQNEEKLWVSVSDSGPGIPKDILDNIFLPFFTTKPVGKGTGLGLSISKGIIDDHGGHFFYDERAEHSTFVIILPLKQSAERAA